jgi:hypothetical protein
MVVCCQIGIYSRALQRKREQETRTGSGQTHQVFFPPVLHVPVPGKYDGSEKLLKIIGREVPAEAMVVAEFVHEFRSIDIPTTAPGEGGGFVDEICEFNLDVSLAD